MTRLVLLPGVGTTARLLDPQRAAFPSLEVPEWLEPQRGESLPSYGSRMARALEPVEGDLVLGGISFGGMVALEMARHLRARVVTLIASCRSASALTVPAHALARVMSRMPNAAFTPPPPLSTFAAWALGARTPPQRALVHELIRTARPGFAKWGLHAIVAWHPKADPACAVRAIHGADDRLIRARRVRAEREVPDAGHLVNVTHAEEVNAFLRAVLDEVTLREASPADHDRVRAFYVACGNSGDFRPQDRVLLAERDGAIIGAVRLCVEEGVQVLRTMRVRKDAQRSGVGRAMLRRFAGMLAPGACYCLPFAHLTGFYGAIGFQEIAPDELPPHLGRRLAQYRTERPGVAVTAMRRS
jgi:pimeloyl-ACP methyl ester carboxylesterase/N-acetylglutamate synthase-like GNAT family acetyltransferase